LLAGAAAVVVVEMQVLQKVVAPVAAVAAVVR
jgi:hypothetical protein